MALATTHKARLFVELKGINEGWLFRDRVLVWLAGHWEENIEKYYSGSNDNLESMFHVEVLQKLDEHYVKKLKNRLA